MSTPMTASPSAACCSSLLRSSGNSVRHGTQPGPQKLTTTGRPRSDARSNACPSSVVPTIGGAGWPRPSSGGSLAPGDGMSFASWTRATVATRAATSPMTMYRRRRSSCSAVMGLLDGQRPGHRGDRVDRADVFVGAGLQRVVLVGLRRSTVDRRLVLQQLRTVGRMEVDVVRDRRPVLVLEEDRERLAGPDLERLLLV